MNSISFEEYQKIVDRSVILERDKHGLKVLETSDGLIVKIFRRKRFLSSALLNPYAARFVVNAKALKHLGFHTIDVEQLVYCTPIKRTLVVYRPIPGVTLRSALQDQGSFEKLMEKFIILLAALHDKGVLFRSIHLNNIIFNGDENPLGLIDIADMKVSRTSLSKTARVRNFCHLARYREDQGSIKSFGVNRFMDIYFNASCLSERCKQEFQVKMQEALTVEGRK